MISAMLWYIRSTHKNQLYFYTLSEHSKKEIKKTIQLTIVFKRIKYFEINLSKEVEDLYWKVQDIAERN